MLSHLCLILSGLENSSSQLCYRFIPQPSQNLTLISMTLPHFGSMPSGKILFFISIVWSIVAFQDRTHMLNCPLILLDCMDQDEKHIRDGFHLFLVTVIHLRKTLQGSQFSAYAGSSSSKLGLLYPEIQKLSEFPVDLGN